jgi:hypothetical protein
MGRKRKDADVSVPKAAVKQSKKMLKESIKGGPSKVERETETETAVSVDDGSNLSQVIYNTSAQTMKQTDLYKAKDPTPSQHPLNHVRQDSPSVPAVPSASVSQRQTSLIPQPSTSFNCLPLILPPQLSKSFDIDSEHCLEKTVEIPSGVKIAYKLWGNTISGSPTTEHSSSSPSSFLIAIHSLVWRQIYLLNIY